MTVPVTLQSYFNGAKACITRASWIDADRLVHNALVQIDSLRTNVLANDALDDAFSAVAVHAADLVAVLTRDTLPSQANAASIEQARQLTLVALDRLDAALTDAEPSEMARAMGLDWY